MTGDKNITIYSSEGVTTFTLLNIESEIFVCLTNESIVIIYCLIDVNKTPKIKVVLRI